MGMFDTLVDHDIRCPRCGSMTRYDIQTKDTPAQLLTEYIVRSPDTRSRGKGEHSLSELFHDRWAFVEDVDEIGGCYSCKSPSCEALARMIEVLDHGSICGSSMTWDVTYPVIGRIVTGPVVWGKCWKGEFIEEAGGDLMILKKFKRKIWYMTKKDSKIAARWEKALKLGMGNVALAVLHLHI